MTKRLVVADFPIIGSFCEYGNTDDFKQKKQKTANKTTPIKTEPQKGRKQYKYNALCYLQTEVPRFFVPKKYKLFTAVKLRGNRRVPS